MPPKRRSAGTAGAPATRTQSTLSFNNKSRVTKQANILPSSTDKKSTSKRLSDQGEAEVVDQISDIEQPQVAEIQNEAKQAEIKDEKKALVSEKQDQDEETAELKPRRKTRKSTLSDYDSRVQTASKISDAKIKSYWKAEEDSRLAPRVHQKDVHIHEKILRHFDLSSQYGPCIGIPRLDRWKRASRLGLDPPIEVLAVLLKEESKGTDKGVGGRQCGQLAYIDELAGGTVVLVE